MSEVTKYQYFLDSMKLILKIKNTIEEEKFVSIIENEITNSCNQKNVSKEDIESLKSFLFNLNESTFYDECMNIYHQFLKYDDKNSSLSVFNFYKLELLNKII